MLFSEERVILKITQSKIALTVQGYGAVSPRKSKTKNHPVRKSVKSAHGPCSFAENKTKNIPVKNTVNSTRVFSQEKVRLKINQSKTKKTSQSKLN